MKTLIVLYEADHAALVDSLVKKEENRSGAAPVVFAMEAELEESLRVRGVAFLSAKNYRDFGPEELRLADRWTDGIFESEGFSALTYRGVPLAKVFPYSFHTYLARMLYWGSTFLRFLEEHQDIGRVIVFDSVQGIPPAGGMLVRKTIQLPRQVIEAVAMGRGLQVEVHSFGAQRSETVKAAVIFSIQKIVFASLVLLVNGSARLRKRRPTRILASEYWRNIGPLVSRLGSDAELILLDRAEMLKAGLYNLWRYRIRLYRPETFAGRNQKRKEAYRNIKSRWLQLLEALPEHELRGFSFRPLVVSALESLVQDSVPRLLEQIDGLKELIKITDPGLIFLRVSTGAQLHFVPLAYLGKEAGIPTLELQHGLEYLKEGSPSRRRFASHIAVYGRFDKQELISAGYEESALSIVGSPRFDRHTAVSHVLNAPLRILCIASDVAPGVQLDSYDTEDFFEDVAQAARAINAHLVIKLRGYGREAFFRNVIQRTMQGVSYEIVKDVPLPELFSRADVTVSSFSTAALESLLCGVPVVLHTRSKTESILLDSLFPVEGERSGALLLTRTPEELSCSFETIKDGALLSRMKEHAKEYVREGYKFDGYSADRAAELVQRLAHR